MAVIKQLLEKIGQRQGQLEQFWLERKTSLDQKLQLKNFEKSVHKVRGWLKTRGEDMTLQSDIGTSLDGVQTALDHHDKCEAKARVSGGGVGGWGQYCLP